MLVTQSGFPRTVKHHALIIYRLLRQRVGADCLGYTATTVACACLLYAIKERNRTNLAPLLNTLRQQCSETDIVALEMWLMSSILEKVIIVEACLRVAFTEFLEVNRGFSPIGEELLSVALAFVSQQYESDDCLRPERGARRAIAAAAAALNWEPFIVPRLWSSSEPFP